MVHHLSREMKIRGLVVLFSALIAFCLLVWFLSRSQTKPSVTNRDPLNIAKRRVSFVWLSGMLTKRDGIWCIRIDDADASPEYVNAFPRLTFGVFSNAMNHVTPFSFYPSERFEKYGHPYPVGEHARWFGVECRNETEFEDYLHLMLTIQAQIGEDPPGRKPKFEGPGFYIVTASPDSK
jgi:hypothetical protein